MPAMLARKVLPRLCTTPTYWSSIGGGEGLLLWKAKAGSHLEALDEKKVSQLTTMFDQVVDNFEEPLQPSGVVFCASRVVEATE